METDHERNEGDMQDHVRTRTVLRAATQFRYEDEMLEHDNNATTEWGVNVIIANHRAAGTNDRCRVKLGDNGKIFPFV